MVKDCHCPRVSAQAPTGPTGRGCPGGLPDAPPLSPEAELLPVLCPLCRTHTQDRKATPSLSGDRGLAKASPGCGLRHEQPRDMHSGKWLAHSLLRGGSGTSTLDVKDPGTADLWAETKTLGGGPSAASQRRSQAAPRPKRLASPLSPPHTRNSNRGDSDK